MMGLKPPFSKPVVLKAKAMANFILHIKKQLNLIQIVMNHKNVQTKIVSDLLLQD